MSSLLLLFGLQLHSSFKIPNLKQIAITVRSPLNAEQKLNTLESLLKCSKNIQKMVIRVSQMRTFQDIADDFFEDIWKFANMNKKIVFIEWIDQKNKSKTWVLNIFFHAQREIHSILITQILSCSRVFLLCHVETSFALKK